MARADDCASFQRKASRFPKNWRKQYPKSQKEVATLSPNTVLKWSRALQAAFERANRNAGRKWVRGVVDEQKLLTDNPWKQFTWIDGTRKPIRQFDAAELLSFARLPGKPVVGHDRLPPRLPRFACGLGAAGPK